MLAEDDVRRLALDLPGAVEEDHHGFASFRVKGKIFATLRDGPPRLMVKLDTEDQHNFCEARPDAFRPVPGYWGRKGSTLVAFDQIDEQLAAMLLRQAWSRIAPKARRSRPAVIRNIS